ncbi:Hsp70 family protein [Saccharothrix deserti]|uniref:Hsp70 family protein n=1 Tax=Saccharothrix deserti TaxID=2593674 RepID=UPI001EE3CE30|nr:Hsp70 family protein [Saccharothrix deserti]
MYALGIDLGTTYTAAATWREGRAQIVSLGARAAAIPSVVLLREDEKFLTGDAANRRGLTEPNRVAREFKRRIGDTTPIMLGGTPYSAEALTSQLLRAVMSEVGTREGAPPSSVCVSHPANWGPYKIDLLRQAVRMADLPSVSFVTEPEAAAVNYAQEQRLGVGAVVAVYDLGGGTFDAAVLRRTTGGFTMLGHPEGIERLGGIDFDAAVFNHVRTTLGSKLDDLDEDDPAALAAVARLREECVQAKESLSADTDTAIPVLLPSVTTEVRLTRGELEAMVRPALHGSIEALRRAVRSAGLTPEQLHSVLLVGGSSRMPIVGQLVSAELGRPVAVDTHPKHAVALGAARLAGGGFGAPAGRTGGRGAGPVERGAGPVERGAGPVERGAAAAAAGLGAAGIGAAALGAGGGAGGGAAGGGAAAGPGAPGSAAAPAGMSGGAGGAAGQAGRLGGAAVGQGGRAGGGTGLGAGSDAVGSAAGPAGTGDGAGGAPAEPGVPGGSAAAGSGGPGGGQAGGPGVDRAGHGGPAGSTDATHAGRELPGERYQTGITVPAGGVAGASRPGEKVGPPPQSAGRSRRVPVLAAGVAALVLLGGVGVGLAALRGDKNPAGPPASSTPASSLPVDEQCTEAIMSNPRWVCLTSAIIADGKITIDYRGDGSPMNINGDQHLHVYGGDGTNPPADVMGMQAPEAERGNWYVEDRRPAVLDVTDERFLTAIGDAPKVCARIADAKHHLVPDANGTFVTGNCVPITRTESTVVTTDPPTRENPQPNPQPNPPPNPPPAKTTTTTSKPPPSNPDGSRPLPGGSAPPSGGSAPPWDEPPPPEDLAPKEDSTP